MNLIRFRWRYLLTLIGLLMLILLVRDFNNRMAELHQLTIERDRVGATVTSMAATRYFLETQLVLATSDSFVEEIAREDLRYSKPGDNPIVLVEVGENQEEISPLPVQTVRPVERWELWLALFIDTKLTDKTDTSSSP